MKKKIVTFFILLVSSLPIAAQNFRVGVTTGTNLHSSTNIDARMGFSIGAKGEYGFNGLDEGLVCRCVAFIRVARMESGFWRSRPSSI